MRDIPLKFLDEKMHYSIILKGTGEDGVNCDMNFLSTINLTEIILDISV